MYRPPPILLSFTLAGILSKRLEDLCFRLGPARAPRRSTHTHTASQQSLWLGLQRSLIVIDTPTLVLGRRASPRWALSPPVVLAGSANSTSRQPVLPPSNSSLPPAPRGRAGGLRAQPFPKKHFERSDSSAAPHRPPVPLYGYPKGPLLARNL